MHPCRSMELGLSSRCLRPCRRHIAYILKWLAMAASRKLCTRRSRRRPHARLQGLAHPLRHHYLRVAFRDLHYFLRELVRLRVYTYPLRESHCVVSSSSTLRVPTALGTLQIRTRRLSSARNIHHIWLESRTPSLMLSMRMRTRSALAPPARLSCIRTACLRKTQAIPL